MDRTATGSDRLGATLQRGRGRFLSAARVVRASAMLVFVTLLGACETTPEQTTPAICQTAPSSASCACELDPNSAACPCRDPDSYACVCALQPNARVCDACPSNDSAARLTRRALGNIGRGVWDQAELEVRCALERDPGYAQAQEVEDQLRLRRSGVLPDMSGFVSYRIRAGDQLGDIAKLCLNQANRFVELAVLNGIENPSRLRPGQLLRIPTTKPCVNCADLRRAALAEEQSTGVERAYALIAAARRSCPNDSDITQDTDRLKSALVTDLHGRAEALLSEGDSGGAAELWQRVIKLDPGNAEAMYFLRSLQN